MTARELLHFLQDLPGFMLDRPVFLDMDEDYFDIEVSDAVSYIAFEMQEEKEVKECLHQSSI